MGTVKVTRAIAEQALREVEWKAQDALTDADIAQQIAANPDAAPDLSGPDATAMRVRWVRKQSGLSQGEFATRYGIPVRTLQEWEQGRREPDATALSYLAVIERAGNAIARALNQPVRPDRATQGKREPRSVLVDDPARYGFIRKRSEAMEQAVGRAARSKAAGEAPNYTKERTHYVRPDPAPAKSSIKGGRSRAPKGA